MSTATTTPEMPPTPTKQLLTITPSPVPTNPSTPEPTDVTTLISPEVVDFCPADPNVLLSNFGVPESTILLLLDKENSALVYYPFNGEGPIPIPNILGDFFFRGSKQISQDHQWIAYEHMNTEGESEGSLELRISSVDGTEQWTLLSEIPNATSIQWLPNNELVFSQMEVRAECPTSREIINPFTLESRPFDYPESSKPQCFFQFLIDEEMEEMITYSFSFPFWYLNDLEKGEHRTVLNWPLEDQFSYHQIQILMHQDAFTVLVPRTYGLGAGNRLGEEELASQVPPLKEFTFTEIVFDSYISWLSADGKLIGFDLLDPEIPSEEIGVNPVPRKFYALDIETEVLRNYCTDRGQARTMSELGYINQFVKSSPDYQFIAWTIYEPEGGVSFPVEVKVMDLESGAIATIPGYELVGWGVLPEE